ncbi:MAG: D-alanine--D-alanine ligase family protein [Bacteroidota bacterium]
MPSPLHVGLIYGGQSSEHEISIRSARSVFEALDADRYRVTLIQIDRDGRWHIDASPDTLFATASATEGAPALFAPQDPNGPVWSAEPDAHSFTSLDAMGLDVAFPMLHGTNGEDGRIQGFLQTLGLAYVGCDVLASAACMNKDATKRLLDHAGLPVTPSRTLRPSDAADFDSLAEALGTPLFVKPANSGSSVGITKVEHAHQLDAALELAFAYDRTVLVETAIEGREIECAVLGNETPHASAPGEIVSTAQFYTYDAKYEDPEASRMEVPADLPPEVSERVRQLALASYVALGCEGMARVDVFVTPEHEVLINEINTIPGFTDRSMYPVMWAHEGLELAALVDRLIELALARHQRDAHLLTIR